MYGSACDAEVFSKKCSISAPNTVVPNAHRSITVAAQKLSLRFRSGLCGSEECESVRKGAKKMRKRAKERKSAKVCERVQKGAKGREKIKQNFS
jgi:hypothetical protein